MVLAFYAGYGSIEDFKSLLRIVYLQHFDEAVAPEHFSKMLTNVMISNGKIFCFAVSQSRSI